MVKTGVKFKFSVSKTSVLLTLFQCLPQELKSPLKNYNMESTVIHNNSTRGKVSQGKGKSKADSKV